MANLDFLIIGGGISGLATAWFLRQSGYSLQVLEAAPEVGGTLKTITRAGFLIEQGPNSTLENTDALRELIDGVGLNTALQIANPIGKRRYIYKNNQLEPLPLNPWSFIRTPLFSPQGKLRLLAEPFIGRAASEESVANFVKRRLGSEFLDWAIDPFISGVYAGDPERLSVRAATAKIYAIEKQYGSLIVGMLRKALSGQQTGPTPSGRMISFAGGMQTLARWVANALGEGAVRKQARVVNLELDTQNNWRVRLAANGGELIAQAVIICLPAEQTAQLLAPLAPAAATALRTIFYPAVASVACGFRREQINHSLDGFGFLIPRRCGIETLGTLFSSSLFPKRAPEGQILLTSFLGGARHIDGLNATNENEIAQRVIRDITPILGITGDPILQSVTLWQHAIPQYELGHLEKIATIDRALMQFPQIYTRANWRDGISVADCVRNARDFAIKIKHQN